jgi:uridine phosphorylase
MESAEIVKDADGRQYHIGLKAGDVAPYILMCGDVERVDKVSKFFDNPTKPIKCREYNTVKGTYKGVPISVMATGMGPDNTEIAIVELSQIVKNPTLIRIGTSGGISSKCKMGSLVISTGAVRMENTSTFFVSEGFPAVAHHEVIMALSEAAAAESADFNVGLTATAPGFYGAQGRTTPVFTSNDTELADKLAKQNVLNLEMEASCLFSLSALANYRAGAVCVVLNDREKNIFISDEGKKTGEKAAIQVGLEAIVHLAAMDKKRGSKEYWTPSMGL